MILAAGISPAWQQALVFDTFTPGKVNRARQLHWCASGKVLNAARALHHLGGPCKALTVVGGTTGAQIQEDFRQLHLAARWIEGVVPTRVCTTILDLAQHSATELVPNAEGLGAEERDAFVTAYKEEAAAAGVVVLIGSLPAGTPAGFYRDLLALTPGKAVLDARGPELLAALSAKPFLIKPNREELQRTVNRPLKDDAALFEAMREMNQHGAEWVVITDGGNPVYAGSRERLYRLCPPRQDVVNPIGCGDCMAAGIAWATFQGREPPDAIRFGVAVAADKLVRQLPGLVDRERVEALVRSTELTRL